MSRRAVTNIDRNDRLVGYVDAEQNAWSIVLSGFDQALTIAIQRSASEPITTSSRSTATWRE